MSTVPARHVLALLAAALLAAPLQAGTTLKVPQQFDTIQAAVNAAVSGDVVQVSKGLYREHVTVTTGGVALRGKSGATIDATYFTDCVTVAANDVEVSGFTLVNGGLNQAAVTDGGPVAGGLHYTGSGAIISKLTVRACQGYGIFLQGTGSIDKCSVDGCPGYGIHVLTPDSTNPTVSVVTRNDVHRCLEGIFAEAGPFDIEKNLTDHCGVIGLGMQINTLVFKILPQVKPSVIRSNTSTGSFQYGMVIADGTGAGAVVDKNTSSDNSFGVLLQGFGLEVTSNTVENNALLGMDVEASGCHLFKNKVRGNGGEGILVAAGSIVSDGPADGSNHVEQNIVQDNGGDGIHGTSSNNDIHDNLVKGNLGDGIQLESGGVSGNQIMANTCTGNGHDGVDNWATLTLIKDNVSKDNGGADLAGIGDGSGTVANGSSGNLSGDGTNLSSLQELDLDTIFL
jgi:parallel beta-helix repeat protein